MQSRSTRISSIRNRNTIMENQYTPTASYTLTTSLPSNGTFTRATTASVIDNLWVINTCKIGEARFHGARRVENLFQDSDNMNAATWTRSAVVITPNYWPAPDGKSSSLTQRIVHNIGSTWLVYQNIGSMPIGTQRTLSFYGRGSGNVTLFCPATGATIGTFALTTDWAYYSASTTTSVVSSFAGFTFAWAEAHDIEIWWPQLQAWLVANEYVSSSLTHGAWVPWVKYFATDSSGVPIPNATLRGYLSEWAATNILLNSRTLTTQSVTVTASAWTLTFYWSGSVALSGAFTGTLSWGTGRRLLTFTPTAWSLTLTVTGQVTFSQLENSNYATSWIPTAGASATRNADTLSIPNPINTTLNNYTISCEITTDQAINISRAVLWSNVANDPLLQVTTSTTVYNFYANVGTPIASRTISYTNNVKIAVRKSATWLWISVNGSAIGTAALGTQVANPSLLYIGYRNTGNQLFGCVENLRIYRSAVSDSRLISLSS